MVRGWISSPKKLQEKFRRTLVLRLFLMENSSNLRLRHNKKENKKRSKKGVSTIAGSLIVLADEIRIWTNRIRKPMGAIRMLTGREERREKERGNVWRESGECCIFVV